MDKPPHAKTAGKTLLVSDEPDVSSLQESWMLQHQAPLHHQSKIFAKSLTARFILAQMIAVAE